MTITALPDAPSRSDMPEDFIAKADAFVAALGNMVTEINATAAGFDTSLWVSGTTYVIGNLVWSPTDYQTYRRKTNGAGATDPSADATNWAKVVYVTNTLSRLIENLGLTVTMAANAVTIALKGADGNDPSASNPVSIGFRNATVTSGASSKVTVTAPLSTVISSGSTGGAVSAQASKIWIAAILNAGAVELAWLNARSGVNIAPVVEGNVISTTAEGGAGAADSAQTWYSTTARSNVPFTILGLFESKQATAGTWAAAATRVVVNPRHRPGDIIQRVRVDTGAVATGSTALPLDDTIPQSTEGDQYMSLAIPCTYEGNVLRARLQAQHAHTSVLRIAGALYQDSTANAIAVGQSVQPAANQAQQVNIDAEFVSGVTGSTTLKYRAGNGGGATLSFNGESGSRGFGGVYNSFMVIEEIQS